MSSTQSSSALLHCNTHKKLAFYVALIVELFSLFYFENIDKWLLHCFLATFNLFFSQCELCCVAFCCLRLRGPRPEISARCGGRISIRKFLTPLKSEASTTSDIFLFCFAVCDVLSENSCHEKGDVHDSHHLDRIRLISKVINRPKLFFLFFLSLAAGRSRCCAHVRRCPDWQCWRDSAFGLRNPAKKGQRENKKGRKQNNNNKKNIQEKNPNKPTPRDRHHEVQRQGTETGHE